MEQGRARLLLKVDNLKASIAWYVQQLGWEVLELADGGGAALMRIGGVQDEAVLVSRHELLEEQGRQEQQEQQEQQELIRACLKRWLLPKHFTPQQGGLVYIGVPSIAEMDKYLRSIGGSAERTVQEQQGHIRELHVPTDEGYTVVFWEELFPSDAEIIQMFEEGVEAFESVIAGFSSEQLGYRELPEKWSIREHVLHVVDLELVAMHKVKFALAETGRLYLGNSFQPDDWQKGLSYADRPIELEVQLFLAARRHILGLCSHLPDALGRTIRTANREETVAQLLKMMAGHASHHIRAIKRIREKYGVDCAFTE